ncbi:MAG: hypothetical protein U0905_21810 [Pirellulales bacterium]
MPLKTCGVNAIRWCICLALAIGMIGCGKESPSESSRSTNPQSSAPPPSTRFKTVVRLPPPIRGTAFQISSASTSDLSQAPTREGTLACAACHNLRPAQIETNKASQLDEYHQRMRFSHSQLTCVSCHNANDDYASLKLADGRKVNFEESMTLCAQCHGPQYRDYEHGAHGGMSGYWDLERGDRIRNHCLHCHDPHVPNYPKFHPVAPPNDRFKPASSVGGTSHDH